MMIGAWQIFREGDRWVAVTDDDDRYTEDAETLEDLIIKIDQIDHPEKVMQ